MEEKKENEFSHKKTNFTEKIRDNPWILSTLICGILIMVLFISTILGGFTGNVISANVAGDKVVNFLNEYLTTDNGITLDSIEDTPEIGVYTVNVDYKDSVIPVYLSYDGEYIDWGSGMINVDSYIEYISDESSEESNTQTEVPKSDKPVVELFVMSYCPYGTQAEKGIIPVAELLGDKIDFRIRYVYYAMHGETEVTENLREYCIQEIAPEKFLDYMTCFLEGDGEVSSSGYITNGNDVNSCLVQAGIDTSSLESCMTEKDQEYSVTENLESGSTYPSFNVDLDLNEEYGISGSPTLVINGVQVSSARDPASYLDAICSSFTDAPEECATQLSSETPSVYFGWDGTGSTSTGQC